MDKTQFWQLIEDSRNKKRDCDKQAAKLEELLSQLNADEIIEFDRIFIILTRENYRWDWWAVAYIINGGCSDDSFDYFRFWVVAQGKDYFEAAIQNPESVADGVGKDPHLECEVISYASSRAYETVTGSRMPPHQDLPSSPDQPLGNCWREEDLPTLYPALWEKFG